MTAAPFAPEAGAGAVARSGRPSRVARCVVVALALFGLVGAIHAQENAVTAPTASSVDGRVSRPRLRALAPVAGAWVTIHRVGSDSAGPIDSMRTGADGRYHFRYARTGKGDAVYFVSASYEGIAYFSRPLVSTHVGGDDAAIIVFDTTSIHFPLAIKGRHIVISSPSVNGSREIVEAYEIANESDQTLVSPDDAHPSWSAPLPAGAANVQVGESDISPAAISASRRSSASDGAVRAGAQAALLFVHRTTNVISAERAARSGSDGARAPARGAAGGGAWRDAQAPAAGDHRAARLSALPRRGRTSGLVDRGARAGGGGRGE